MVKMNKLVVNKIEEENKRASKKKWNKPNVFRPILHHSAHHPSFK